jgi:hypothetical protein
VDAIPQAGTVPALCNFHVFRPDDERAAAWAALPFPHAWPVRCLAALTDDCENFDVLPNCEFMIDLLWDLHYACHVDFLLCEFGARSRAWPQLSSPEYFHCRLARVRTNECSQPTRSKAALNVPYVIWKDDKRILVTPHDTLGLSVNMAVRGIANFETHWKINDERHRSSPFGFAVVITFVASAWQSARRARRGDSR